MIGVSRSELSRKQTVYFPQCSDYRSTLTYSVASICSGTDVRKGSELVLMGQRCERRRDFLTMKLYR